jgi:ferrous iron transport protein B
MESTTEDRQALLREAEQLRWKLPPNFHDRCVEAIYGDAAQIARRNVSQAGSAGPLPWERRLDKLLTGRWTGFPMMALLLGIVLWLTILGANKPSAMLDSALIGWAYPQLQDAFAAMSVPAWITGLLVDGVYLTVAWVISVMLPPMAIFFPLFTLLEDFGYLPRVAFNLDRLFQRSGAHGKQALTMAMGFGCNAAAIVSTRVIDSPREKLIAILTNNFALCNGRWPTQILIATIFLGALVPPALAGFVAASAVLAVTLLGVGLTLLTSWGLSKTVLKGEASTFSLELPPYRPPRFWQTLYTSLIDRTVFVLWRAIVFAAPAGIAIWGSANLMIGDQSLAAWLIEGLDPLAWFLGLTGVVLVAYIIAIPANEIVIPSILMLTTLVLGNAEVGQGAGVMFEFENEMSTRELLVAAGWTPLTGICLMLFSLCHNPCSTTLYTIYKETGSAKWTTWAALLPTVIGLVLCLLVAAAWRLAF